MSGTDRGATGTARADANAEEMIAPWLRDGPDATAEALSLNQAQFQVLTDAMPQMVWSTRPDGYHDYYNARWYEFTGVPAGSTDGEAWNDMFHPDDQARAWETWRHCLATGEAYEIEYRLRHHSGAYRWTLGRALPVRDEAGQIVRWIGTCTDIDDAKRDAEQNELLSRELSHRIKNIFAVISGLIALSSRGEPAVRSFARNLQDRIAALGRAHDFARPHSEHSRPVPTSSDLHGLISEVVAPYPARDEGRIVIRGDNVPVDDRGATPIGLAVHELATNAAKYGALSTLEGSILIETRRTQSELELFWRESGGPKIESEPSHMGFGSRLVELSINQQLGGSITRYWRPEGLEVRIVVAAEHLRRD